MFINKTLLISKHQSIHLLEYVEKQIRGSELMSGPTAYVAVIRTWVWK